MVRSSVCFPPVSFFSLPLSVSAYEVPGCGSCSWPFSTSLPDHQSLNKWSGLPGYISAPCFFLCITYLVLLLCVPVFCASQPDLLPPVCTSPCSINYLVSSCLSMDHQPANLYRLFSIIPINTCLKLVYNLHLGPFLCCSMTISYAALNVYFSEAVCSYMHIIPSIQWKEPKVQVFPKTAQRRQSGQC